MEQKPVCVGVEEASRCGGRYCGSCGGRSRRRGLVGAEEGLLSALLSVFLLVWNPYRKGGTNFPSGPLSLFLRPCASLIRATYDA